MGQTTANMSIFIPSNGETLYGDSFAAGMLNVDLHDHSGPPNNGVPLSASGLGDYSVTAIKLNNTGTTSVAESGGGLAFNANNQLIIDPTYLAAIPSTVKVRTITTTGAYTPTAGTVFCIVECYGGGGGGGGTTTTVSAGGGGGSGAYSRSGMAVAAATGQTITIGTAGAAGTTAGNGGTGGTTSFGALVVAVGGVGGLYAAGTTVMGYFGGAGGLASSGTGQVTASGMSGGNVFIIAGNALGGFGGASMLGGGYPGGVACGTNNSSYGGSDGNSYGAGGSGGAATGAASTAVTGGAGAQGACIITEFISTL